MSTNQVQSLSRVQHQYRMFHNIYVQLDDGDQHVLDQFDLTTSQYAVLQLLNEKHGQRPIDLSEKLLCARSTVTRLVDQMEKAGLARRIADPDDRRAQLVVLTAEGAKLKERARTAHEKSLLERLGTLSVAEQEQLNALLEKVRENLKHNLHQIKQGGDLPFEELSDTLKNESD